MLNGIDDNSYELMCVIVVNPALADFEIEKLPTLFSVDKKGAANKVFGKTSARISRIIYMI